MRRKSKLAPLFLLLFLGVAVGTSVTPPAAAEDAKQTLSAPDRPRPSPAAHEYHFSPDGDDAAGDASADHPWASLQKAGGLSLHPGDKLLLAGGRTFRGHLLLDHDATGTAGTADAPITVGSYGQGRAVIEAGDDDGILVRNTGGVVVENLVLRGANAVKNAADGAADAGPGGGPVRSNRRSGVKFLNTLPGARRLAFVRVEHVEACGFGREGVVVIGWAADKSQSGFRDVRITDCSAHDNTYCGIYVSGVFDAKATDYADADVYVGRCTAYANRGDPDFRDNHSGSGIFVEDTDGAVVEDCTAHDNGDLCPGTHGGPCGVWAASARGVTIQRCESYANHCARPVDGDGFDFDGGCTHCLMQYNYSHDNQGAGFLVYNYKYAPHAFADVVVRYNVSENDARQGDYAALHVVNDGDGMKDVAAYNNTLFVGPRAAGDVPQAVRVERTAETHFLNNVFCAGTRGEAGGGVGRGVAGGVAGERRTASRDVLVAIGAAQPGLLFCGNCYWSATGPVRISDGPDTYDSLESWRKATGQERDGRADTGLAADPRLADPGHCGALDGRSRKAALAGYRLRQESPLHNAGVAVERVDSFPPSEHDFFDRPLTGTGRRTIGAGD